MVTISLDFLANRGQSYSPRGSHTVKSISHAQRACFRIRLSPTGELGRPPPPSHGDDPPLLEIPPDKRLQDLLKAVTMSLACPLMTIQAPVAAFLCGHGGGGGAGGVLEKPCAWLGALQGSPGPPPQPSPTSGQRVVIDVLVTTRPTQGRAVSESMRPCRVNSQRPVVVCT